MSAFGACLGVAPFASGASCTGPPPLEFRIQSHPDAATYAELGKWFGHNKQYSCAIEAFRAGLLLEPDSAELSYLLGLTLYTNGDPKAAITPLQQSIPRMPTAVEPHLLLAAAFEELRLRDKAKAEYEAAIQVDPHSTKALSGLSKLFLADGNYSAVIGLLRSAALDEALTMDLAHAYVETHMLDQAAQILVQALRMSPSSLRLTNALSTVYVNQEHFREAVQVAEKSVRLHPDSMEAQSLYLRVLVLDREMDTARPLAKKLLATHPHDFEVLYLNGMLEREAGQYNTARQNLEEAVTLNPTHFQARYDLGIVLAELKDPAGAKVQLEKALALGAGSNESQVRYRLAGVLRTLGENEQAEEQAKITAERLQEEADQRLAVVKAEEAEVALKTGNPQKAAALYREAVEATPNDALLNYKLAMALDRIGDTAAEQVALQQVVKIDPTFALAHNQLGYLASRDGDFTSAVEQFRATVQFAPGYAEGWVNLAAALGMESQLPEALEAITRAIKLDPKNDQAREVRQRLKYAQGQR
ncbi:MAG: tetratricopeptide repeat protein [Candidatus Sulfotelmatobacter sp.]